MVRWRPLTDYLQDAGEERLELTYKQVEEILGGSIPRSAVDHRSVFWSNSKAGGYSRHWRAAGYRTVLRGMPDDAVAFVREADDTMGASRVDRQRTHDDFATAADVLLVGCVKTKATEARRARDLYTSSLFAKRRDYAQSAGVPWVILSAEYGAVHPDAVIEPYDRYLEDQPGPYRQEWGRRVVNQLEALFGSLSHKVFELHASRAYGDPIEPLLRERGATMRRPLDGLLFGQQLQWYDGQLASTQAGEQGSREPAASRPGQSASVTVETDVADASGLGARISAAFTRGQLDLSARAGAPAVGWAGMPEIRAFERVRSEGADGVAARTFGTLISAMDRARDADLLWDRGASAFAATPWIFDPSEVVERSFTELLDVLRAAGLSQRHATDVGAWRVIAESLAGDSVPVVTSAIRGGRADARVLLNAVQARTPTGSDRFPLLRGPKIRAMWIRILAHPGGATIANLEAVPVAVDVQVRKVTENLGVTDTTDLPLESVREQMQRTWAGDVAAYGADGPASIAGTAAALDPALWFYGKWGCTFCERAGAARPIHEICQHCRLA